MPSLIINNSDSTVGLRLEAGASPSAGRMQLHAFEGSKIRVIGVERAGPSRQAALQRLDCRPRGHPAHPLDLAKVQRRISQWLRSL